MKQRNVNLSKRNENKKDKIVKLELDVREFSLNEIFEHFTDSLQGISTQLNLAANLRNNGQITESEDILRAQIVGVVSAFDFYLHELTKYGICAMYKEEWGETPEYKKLKVSMELLDSVRRTQSKYDTKELLKYMNKNYMKDSMISVKNFKEQLKLLDIKLESIVNKLFGLQGKRDEKIERLSAVLDEIFNRRNAIAHQSDRDHKDAKIHSITENEVKGFILSIKNIVEAIDSEARSKKVRQ